MGVNLKKSIGALNTFEKVSKVMAPLCCHGNSNFDQTHLLRIYLFSSKSIFIQEHPVWHIASLNGALIQHKSNKIYMQMYQLKHNNKLYMYTDITYTFLGNLWRSISWMSFFFFTVLWFMFKLGRCQHWKGSQPVKFHCYLCLLQFSLGCKIWPLIKSLPTRKAKTFSKKWLN